MPTLQAQIAIICIMKPARNYNFAELKWYNDRNTVGNTHPCHLCTQVVNKNA